MGSYSLRLSLARAQKEGDLRLNGFGLKEVPPEIISLTHLTSLELSRNQIEELPEGLSNLVNLRTLSLDSNQLKTIPPWIAHLRHLRWLLLDYNKIDRIPWELLELPNLHGLAIRENSLPEDIFVFGDREECVSTITKMATLTDWRCLPWSVDTHERMPVELQTEIEELYFLYRLAQYQGTEFDIDEDFDEDFKSNTSLAQLPVELIFHIFEFMRIAHLATPVRSSLYFS